MKFQSLLVSMLATLTRQIMTFRS